MSHDRKFGFWTLTFLVVGNMIGAGVFTTSGYSLASLGSPTLVVAAWCVGGIIAIAGAYSYGQLVQHMPESGGEYLFLSQAVHPLFGCIAGWISLIAGFSGPIAFSATTFETYALPAEFRPAWYREDMLGCGVILFCLAWHILRPRVGEIGQNFVVAMKLIMLTVFLGVAFGFQNGPSGSAWQGAETAVDTFESVPSLCFAFAGALVWISLSFSGFNAAVYVASEVRYPQTIAKALVTATFSVAVIYVLLNTVFVFAPPHEHVALKPDVAAVAAEWVSGPRLAIFVRITIAIALFTSVSSMMLAAPRVYAKMADDGVMPSWMAFAGGYPRVAMVVQAVLAITMVISSTLYGLLEYLSLTLAISAAATVACLFSPSVRPRVQQSYKFIPPAVFVVATLVSATLLAIDKPLTLIGTAATAVVGSIGYLVVRQHQKSVIDEAS